MHGGYVVLHVRVHYMCTHVHVCICMEEKRLCGITIWGLDSYVMQAKMCMYIASVPGLPRCVHFNYVWAENIKTGNG